MHIIESIESLWGLKIYFQRGPQFSLTKHKLHWNFSFYIYPSKAVTTKEYTVYIHHIFDKKQTKNKS